MNSFTRLARSGVAVWLDDLSRSLLQSGDLERMVAGGTVLGVTTNPTIFSKSISAGAGYADQLRELALRGTAIGEALRLLTAWDVRAACDILRPVYEPSGKRDGRVSIEVDPRISGDAERTAAEARGLWWLVDRPNLFIKIPATRAGLHAITKSLAEGIRHQCHADLLARSIQGCTRRVHGWTRAAGGERGRPGRDRERCFILRQPSGHGSGPAAEKNWSRRSVPGCRTRHLFGEAALANARLAYEIYEAAQSSDRWKALSAQGAKLQRLLWASTGVKDKAFPATRYVTELVARDTVNTMPKATLAAVETFECAIADTVRSRYGEAKLVVERLARVGVDLANVADVLERQGVASFAESWDELVKSVKEQLENAGANVMPAGAVIPAAKCVGSSNAPAAASPTRTARPERPA
jgi:transaldolase